MQALQNPSTLYSKVLGRTSFFITGHRNGGFCLCTRKQWAAKGPWNFDRQVASPVFEAKSYRHPSTVNCQPSTVNRQLSSRIKVYV